MRSAFFRLLVIAGFLVSASSSVAEDLDIVGVKLGMTVEEATEALLSYGVSPDIQEYRQQYNYSDGINHNLKTDAFVAYIEAARMTDNADYLSVFFSPGPEGGRVVAVVRTLDIRSNPPTRRQYIDALIEKYGPPTVEDISTVQWDRPVGKIQCIVGAVGSYSPTQPSILKKIYANNIGSRDASFHKREVKSLDDCASYVTYAMPSGDDTLITNVKATMIDVAGTAEGELAANEWVAGLIEAARGKAKSGGTVPAN